MHGKIGAPFEERFLNFLDEKSLAADLRERSILNAIAASYNCEFLRLKGRVMLLKGSNERSRLREGERGAPRCVDQPHLNWRVPRSAR
jgi:hypothetical protein